MSEYENYETPVTYPWGGSVEPGAPLSSGGPPNAAPVVLARVPNLDAPPAPVMATVVEEHGRERARRREHQREQHRDHTHHGERDQDDVEVLSAWGTATSLTGWMRSWWTIGATMVVMVAIGFMLGRAGRESTTDMPDAWRPPAPAPSAAEAPAWPGSSVAETASMPASPLFASPIIEPTVSNIETSTPPTASNTETRAEPTAPNTQANEPSDIPPPTPWSYPDQSTTTPNHAFGATQPYSGSNRGMTIESTPTAVESVEVASPNYPNNNNPPPSRW